LDVALGKELKTRRSLLDPVSAPLESSGWRQLSEMRIWDNEALGNNILNKGNINTHSHLQTALPETPSTGVVRLI
jgi:hypothetical protein